MINLEKIKKVPKRKLLSELKYSEKQLKYWQVSIEKLEDDIKEKQAIIAYRQQNNVAKYQKLIDALDTELVLRQNRPKKKQGNNL